MNSLPPRVPARGGFFLRAAAKPCHQPSGGGALTWVFSGAARFSLGRRHPRKLPQVSLFTRPGWRPRTSLKAGLQQNYAWPPVWKGTAGFLQKIGQAV